MVLLGSSDLTEDLLNEILRDYSVEQLEVIDFDSSLRYATFRNRRFALVNDRDVLVWNLSFRTECNGVKNLFFNLKFL